MDLNDELFDVSYAEIDETEQSRLLKSWVAGEQNVISIGKSYTEKMSDGWRSLSSSLGSSANWLTVATFKI